MRCRMSLDDALRKARTARKFVCPNAGFLHQLMVFEQAECHPEVDFSVHEEKMKEQGIRPSAQVCVTQKGEALFHWSRGRPIGKR